MGLTTAEKIRITERNAALGLQAQGDLDDLNARGHMSAPVRPVTNLLNIPDSWGERQRALAGEYGRSRHNGRTISHEVTRTAAGGGIDNPVPLNLLIRHMETHYSEYQLRHDLDCVLSLCTTEADRRVIRDFVARKLTGKPYAGYGLNVRGVTCESCRNPFTSRRSDARFCSAKCRVKSARRNKGCVLQITPLPSEVTGGLEGRSLAGIPPRSFSAVIRNTEGARLVRL